MIERVWGNAWLRWGAAALVAFAGAWLLLTGEQLRVACSVILTVGALSAANNWVPDAITTARLGETGAEQRIIVGQALMSIGLVALSLYVAAFNALGRPPAWANTPFMPFSLFLTAVGLFLNSTTTPDGYIPTGSRRWGAGLAVLGVMLLLIGFMAGAAFSESETPVIQWWP